MKIKNTIIMHNEYAEIIVEKPNYYKHSVLLDFDDLKKVGCMRITNTGYAYCRRNGGKSVSHVVMNHTSNIKTVIDHINGNTLDNRKHNLRIVTQLENNYNKRSFIRNNTGKMGIAYRERGNYKYYRVSVSDRKDFVGNRQEKRYTKQFNINKLGKTVAFLLAKEWLSNKRKELGYKHDF